jgi:hypothetical protein
MIQMTTRDLELIAIMAHARAPVARIAAALGISEPEYSAWLQRLALGRAYVAPVTIPARPVRKVPARLRAERFFESATEAQDAPIKDYELECLS